MKDMDKIKSLAKQILAACDEQGDVDNGTAPEHDNAESDDDDGESDSGMKSLKMSLSKYK